MYLKEISLISLLLLLIVGCSSSGEKNYSHNETNRIQTTLTGTIKHIEKVNVDGESSWKGSLTGSVLGGLLGSTIGGGWGRLIVSTASSVAGGFVGGATEEQLTRNEGLKMIIVQNDGNIFTVVIVPKEGESFTVGQEVEVVTSEDGKAEVHPLTQ